VLLIELISFGRSAALKRLASAVQLRPWPPYFQSLNAATDPESVPFCSKIPIQACRSLPRILGNFFSLILRLAEVRGISCGVLRVMVAEVSQENRCQHFRIFDLGSANSQ
jgi:hypothetical protein